MTYGLYDTNNAVRTTTVSGTSPTGLYAADGSINIVLNDVSHTGLYHPCGALRVNSSTGVGYDPSGAYYLRTLLGAGNAVPQITNNVLVSNGTVTPGSLSSAITVPFTFISEHNTSPQGAVSNLKTVDVGWYYNDNGTTMSEGNIGGTYTMKRFIEYPSGTFTAVNWAASPSATMLDGGQLVSDATTITIPASTKYWIRTVITAVSGANVVPLASIPNAPTLLGVIIGSAAGDLGNSSSVPASALTSDVYRPQAILGTVAILNAKAHILVGDSITAIGQGDTLSVGSNGGSGPLSRTIDPICSYTRIGRQAIAAKDIAASNTKLQTLIAALGGFTHVGVFLGTNDFNTRYNRTAAQCLTDCSTILGLFTNTGVTKYQVTVGGGSTSTDGFKSSGNQTADATHLAQVPTFNVAVRAIPVSLNGGFCYDYGAYTVPITDTCIWRTPYVMTADGTHPNTYAANWIANQARPALFGGSYLAEAETAAFFAACVTAGLTSPPAVWKDNYNSLIFMSKQNAWWNQRSVIRLFNTYDRNIAKRNIKRDGDHAVESATVAWTTKVGFLFGGTGKLTSTYNVTTATDALWTQNSAGINIDVNTNEAIANGATDWACWSGTAGSFFTARNSVNAAQGRINCAANQATAATVTDSTGNWAMVRTASTTTNIDLNAASVVTNANASVAIVSATEEIGGLGTNYTNKTVRSYDAGAGMSLAQIGNRNYDVNCFNTVAQGL